MPVHNSDVIRILKEVADLLEIEGANPFRVRAYRNAAGTIGRLPYDIADRVEEGEDLTSLEGIGEDMADKIEEIVETGDLEQLQELRKRTPAELANLMKIEGLGAKRVQQLYEALGITTREDLAQAARQGKVREIEGFGETMESDILDQLEQAQGDTERILLSTAEEIGEPLVAYLRDHNDVERAEIAGSYRRRKETVGDLDIVVISDAGEKISDYLADYEDVTDVISTGETRARVILRSGLAVDMRIMAVEHFGAGLFYLTGSRDHNLNLRNIAIDRDLKLNEYGVFREDEQIAGETEEDLYAAFDLPYIPPELREDRGEIEAARNGELPDLITLDDLRGNLHTHTVASDGHDSLEDMVDAAREHGFEYLAITDHSPNVAITQGLDIDRLKAQMDQIAELNDRHDNITLLRGIEVDILEDGTLDLPDDMLAKLDVVICAIHSKLNLPREQQTERVLRALDNPHVHILAHPTERRINERGPMDLDMERIIKAAAERNIALEINAQPNRLDLDDAACKMARANGALIAISADAHFIVGLDYLRYGVNQARRGWLEARDVLNTRSVDDLRQFLKR